MQHAPAASIHPIDYRTAMQRAGRDYLETVLRSTESLTQAARLAGCHRTHFYKLLRRHGIALPDRESIAA